MDQHLDAGSFVSAKKLIAKLLNKTFHLAARTVVKIA